MAGSVLRWFGLTDRGTRREQNEDAFLADGWMAWGQTRQAQSGALDTAQPRVFALADGMGGHENGALASRNALSFLYREVEVYLSSPPAIPPGQEIPGFLLTAFQRIHEKITAMGAGRLRPMGTTLTALMTSGSWAFAAHAGDSQLWRWDGQSLKLLTEDHNEAWENPAWGARSLLNSCMGGGMDNPRIDVFPVPIRSGDLFLLNSDGLNEDLAPGALERIFQTGGSLEDLGTALVQEALKSSSDNISVLLIQVP